MLSLTLDQRDAIIASCVRALPNEGCGVLIGRDDTVTEVVASNNVADSAKIYEVDSRVLLRAYRRAEADGSDVIGVFHSHTHSDAFPSPTDVRQAPDPTWHYVIVSLRLAPTVLRSYLVRDEVITEEDVLLSS